MAVAKHGVEAIALLMATSAGASDRMSSCWSDQPLTTYNPALIRAVEQRLQARALYHGPVDGVVTPALCRVISRLDPRPTTADFRLTATLMRRLFGSHRGSVVTARDQDEAVMRLHLTPNPNYPKPCPPWHPPVPAKQ